jgi:hypothetical protein
MEKQLEQNLLLFFTHFDDYLDISLEIVEGFDEIKKLKSELKSKKDSISLEDYHKEEVKIFMQYLNTIGVIQQEKSYIPITNKLFGRNDMVSFASYCTGEDTLEIDSKFYKWRLQNDKL